MNNLSKISSLILFLFSIQVLEAQFSIIGGFSQGENRAPIDEYKTFYYLNKVNFGLNYSFYKRFSFESNVQYLKYDYVVSTDGFSSHRNKKLIGFYLLKGDAKMKTLGFDSNMGFSFLGFFIKAGVGIGKSFHRTDWSYRFTDYIEDIDIRQRFEDLYSNILTYNHYLIIGYKYTYKNIISLGIFWEKIKYFGETRNLINRVGYYNPHPDFAPAAISPEKIYVNPDCYLWGFMLEYHFPRKK